MKSNFEYNFVYCFDSNYNLQAFTSIYSLLKNIKTKINIHIVHENKNLREVIPSIILSNENLENLIIYEFQNSNIDFPNIKGTHVSDATYFRLFIQDYVDNQIENLIYIDADTLFLNNPTNSIKNNFEKLLSDGNYVAANTEFYLTEENEKAKRLKIDKSYFNAGVLLINFKRWVDDELTKKLVNHLDLIKNDVVEWDQDVLNSYFNGNYTELDKRLNFNSNQITKNLIDAGKIDLIHFIGSKKPWTLDGIFNITSKYYHSYYSEIFNSKYHLIHAWRKRSILIYIKSIVNLNLFRFVRPWVFTKEFIKSLFKS